MNRLFLPIVGVVMILLGALALAGALLQPAFFWHNDRARAVSRALGHGGATAFYVVLGAAFVGAGIVAIVRGVRRMRKTG